MDIDVQQLTLALGTVLMRQRVMPTGRANFWISAAAKLPPDHKGNNPRQITLIRKHLQIKH